jgi:hypothetical protein
LEHLGQLFKIDKVDDTVASEVDEAKLMNYGMVYGDIISFRSAFPRNKTDDIKATYQERAKSLKEKLNMNRTERRDTKNRVVCVKSTYNLNIQLKCKEKEKFVSKRKAICELVVDVRTSYEDIHKRARSFFGVKHTNTILANFNNKSIEKTMATFADFLSLQKEKKRLINMYLLYPHNSFQLALEKTLDKPREILNFCNTCLSEYTEFCVECALSEENLSVEKEKSILEDSEEHPEPLPSLPTRSLSSRDRQRPVRFRHSIGENLVDLRENLVDLTENLVDLTKDDTYGKEETERFFEQQADNSETPIENMQPKGSEILDLNEAYDEYVNRPKTQKTILVQRDRSCFWRILFRQTFNLGTQDVKVRFAGEPASDVGGPLREFLTLSMRWLNDLDYLFIGRGNNVAFQMNTEALLQNKYYTLGQIIALSILVQGRGPECFHPSVVCACFELEQPVEIKNIDDSRIELDLQSIRLGNYDCLLEMNVVPFGKPISELIRLYMIATLVHSKFSAISQFSSGVRTISKSLFDPSNYNFMRTFLESSAVEYTFDQIISLMSYQQIKLKVFENGSNDESNLRECIAEFEMFLINIGIGLVFLEENVALRYTDLIFFITGCDRIPPFGFEKNIDIFFEDVSLPKASTCGLILTLPKKASTLGASIITAVKFGGGFGEI